MNKNNINVPLAGTEADSIPSAQNHSASQPNANTNVGRSAVDKSIKLITALLNGKELEKHHAEYESPWYDNQVSWPRCYFSEYNGGEMFFEIGGWGSAFGKPEDRVIDVIKNPEKWDVS